MAPGSFATVADMDMDRDRPPLPQHRRLPPVHMNDGQCGLVHDASSNPLPGRSDSGAAGFLTERQAPHECESAFWNVRDRPLCIDLRWPSGVYGPEAPPGRYRWIEGPGHSPADGDR